MKDFDYAAWRAMALVRACSACVFYVPSGHGGGYCHRFPAPSYLEPHPRVGTDDWCGEFVFNPDAAKEPEHVFHSPNPEPGQLE